MSHTLKQSFCVQAWLESTTLGHTMHMRMGGAVLAWCLPSQCSYQQPDKAVFIVAEESPS